MMEFAAGFWSHAPKLGLAIVVIAVAYFVVRLVRSRRPVAPPRTIVPPMAPDDPANLDSSHIGGPMFESPDDRSVRPSGSGNKGEGR